VSDDPRTADGKAWPSVAREDEFEVTAGFVEPRLRAEFPGLRLDWLTIAARGGRASSAAVRDRLRQLSDRYRGANAVAMRTQPIPHAYRTFFRQIGLDPDVNRIPSEQAAVERLLHGQFRSRGLVADALLIALLETGVPTWALDARWLHTCGLGIRVSVAGDRLGSRTPGHHSATGRQPAAEGHLPAGRLVVCDARAVHALLFGEIAPTHVVGSRTRRLALFTVAVDGVPALHVDEALWVCVEALGG
jgi:DNA/RNA-binding domain of Phe-tRNA-synthetase-like protein